VWRRVFDPPHSESKGERDPVVVPEKCEHYELMREVCELHANTNLDYSLIVQVDEFWHQRNAFRSQVDYLTRPMDEPVDAKGDRKHVEKRAARREWFDRVDYGLPEGDDRERFPDIDRIPFVWDFGFLACRERLWNEATTLDAAAPGEGTMHQLAKRREHTRRVWNRIKKGQTSRWVDVLEAAAYVAMWESARQSKPVPAFDLAMAAPQTFSCLVLEIWFSEIYSSRNYRNDPEKRKRLANIMKSRRWKESSDEDLTLAKLADEYWLELYCTWLLLAEVLNLGTFESRPEGFGFSFGRLADPHAVASRQWYKSAAVIDDDEERSGPMRFCRLPGNFSVRGDWFLAAVRGSRSDRLADRALDLLSSPEANIDRLMQGLGLPTRTLKDSEVSSRLRGWHCDRKDAGTLTYRNLLSMGESASHDFHWLWRGNLKNYYAGAPVWERWLFRVLRRWKRTRELVASDWVSGFDLYRKIKRGGSTLDEVKKFVSYGDFKDNMCKVLRDELNQVNL
jgi:hypothetical protein